MKIAIILLFVITLSSLPTNGLICWFCENQPSLEACILHGTAKFCIEGPNQSCQTHVRVRNEKQNKMFQISRDCKQREACFNNQANNERECKPNNLHYECRCCCEEDFCHMYDIENCGGLPPLTTTSTLFQPSPTPTPVCSEPEEIENGKKICGERIPEGFLVGSTCTYECNEGYRIENDQVRVCGFSNISSTYEFNGTTPTCRKAICERPIDLVIILDSSSSIGIDNWIIMTTFVINFTKTLNINPNIVNVAIFRFNREVDEDTAVLFGSSASKDGAELINRIMAIPYNGSGTNTGTALQYARDTVFATNNRPEATDVLIVLTDGRTSRKEKMKVIEQSRRLSKVEYRFAIGVGAKEDKEFRNELQTIAGGHPDRVLPVEDFHALSNDFAQSLATIACPE